VKNPKDPKAALVERRVRFGEQRRNHGKLVNILVSIKKLFIKDIFIFS
jgi:hypothetical protein